MEKLFQEFNEVDLDQWLEKIQADLKGKPIESLHHSPEKEINIRSYYHNQQASSTGFYNGKITNNWKNRRYYKQPINQQILNDLNDGIDCLGLVFNDQDSFEQQTRDVQFRFIDADVKFQTRETAMQFDGPDSIRLNYDVLGHSIRSGKAEGTIQSYLEFFDAHKKHQTIWVSGAIYGDSGSSTIQELAFAANHLNEYIQALTDHGVSLQEINQKIVVELSITNNFFVNIAKFKVFRDLAALIFKAYDNSFKPESITLYGSTSQRFIAENDANNNFLRQTTQAMSAIIGGCDVITVVPAESQNKDREILNQRIAKNIPLILKEESYLDKVADPAEGAYFVNDLCQQLLEKSWELFKEIEEDGGWMQAVETNKIQNVIEENRTFLLENMNSGKTTFLGVNKYPSTLEEWKDVSPKESVSGVTFKALTTFKLEEHYKKEIHEQSNI